MKIVISIIAVVLGLGAVNANASEFSPEQQIAAEVIIRQVVVKKLLGTSREAKAETKLLAAMINREIKAPYTSISITDIQCDHVLGGKDQCQFDVVDATTDGTESMSRLEVTIEKGDVKSATLTLIAG